MVKYLKIQGEDRPIRVSYYALKKLKEELGRTLKKDDDGSDYAAYEALLFYSLEKGHQKMNVPLPFKREDMEELMDECYFAFMAIVPEFFEDQLTQDAPKAKGEVVEKKRKA